MGGGGGGGEPPIETPSLVLGSADCYPHLKASAFTCSTPFADTSICSSSSPGAVHACSVPPRRFPSESIVASLPYCQGVMPRKSARRRTTQGSHGPVVAEELECLQLCHCVPGHQSSCVCVCVCVCVFYSAQGKTSPPVSIPQNRSSPATVPKPCSP